MKMPESITVSMPQLMSTLTFKTRVKRRREYRLRIWIGSRLIPFAAWVIGVGRCEIIDD